MAVESAPSEVVGYVKYANVTGLNYVALPMESGYAWASDIANAYPGTMDFLSYWDASIQTWVTATDLGGFFDGDFEVAPGLPVMVDALSDFNFYSMGTMPASAASYSFATGLNGMMIPLNHSELTWANEVAASVGTIDFLSYWDPAIQTWVTATDLGGFFDGDFEVSIGMPLMIDSMSDTTWPGAKSIKASNVSRASK